MVTTWRQRLDDSRRALTQPTPAPAPHGLTADQQAVLQEVHNALLDPELGLQQQVAEVLRRLDDRPAPINALDLYVTAAPSAQTAVDLFAGEWASAFPPEVGVAAGEAPLFEDPRIGWLLDQIDGVEGKRVLELGPLEGGHSYQLERAGAAEITGIEAHGRAFLRCLVVKELLGLHRAHFRCGDFVEHLRSRPPRVDLVVASGVLYHMRNPVELLALCAEVTDTLFLWTHYYDAALLAKTADVDVRFPESVPSEHAGYQHTLYRQTYGVALTSASFCGGSTTFSNWLDRDDLLGALAHVGFSYVAVAFDEKEHPNGPSLALVARRTAP